MENENETKIYIGLNLTDETKSFLSRTLEEGILNTLEFDEILVNKLEEIGAIKDKNINGLKLIQHLVNNITLFKSNPEKDLNLNESLIYNIRIYLNSLLMLNGLLTELLEKDLKDNVNLIRLFEKYKDWGKKEGLA